MSVWQVSELRWVGIVFKSNRDMSSKMVSLWFEMYPPEPREILRLTLSALGSRRVTSVEETNDIWWMLFGGREEPLIEYILRNNIMDSLIHPVHMSMFPWANT